MFYLLLRLFQGKTDAEIFTAIDPIRNVTIIGTLAWFLIRFVKEFKQAYIKRQYENGDKVDITTANALLNSFVLQYFITAALVYVTNSRL